MFWPWKIEVPELPKREVPQWTEAPKQTTETVHPSYRLTDGGIAIVLGRNATLTLTYSAWEEMKRTVDALLAQAKGSP